MAINGNQWQSMAINGNQWQSNAGIYNSCVQRARTGCAPRFLSISGSWEPHWGSRLGPHRRTPAPVSLGSFINVLDQLIGEAGQPINNWSKDGRRYTTKNKSSNNYHSRPPRL